VDPRLQQAIRTLRALRQRYEVERNVGSDYVRAYSVQVALGYSDMHWISAAIEALEKADQILIGCMECGRKWTGPRAADAPQGAALHVGHCGCERPATVAPYYVDGDGEPIE
jgi:hypothetical protein